MCLILALFDCVGELVGLGVSLSWLQAPFLNGPCVAIAGPLGMHIGGHMLQKTQSPWLLDNHGLWTLSPLAASVSIRKLIDYPCFTVPSPLALNFYSERASVQNQKEERRQFQTRHLFDVDRTNHESGNRLNQAFSRRVCIDCTRPRVCPRRRLAHRHLMHQS